MFLAFVQEIKDFPKNLVVEICKLPQCTVLQDKIKDPERC